MPFEYTWEQNGFYSKFWGTVLNKEIESKNFYFSNDSRCDKTQYQILDGSKIETLSLTDDDITKMASNDIGMGFYLKKFSMVFVCPNPDVRSVFEKYISTCERSGIPWTYHLCDTLPQARAWLKRRKKQETNTLGLSKKAKTNNASSKPQTNDSTKDANCTCQNPIN